MTTPCRRIGGIPTPPSSEGGPRSVTATDSVTVAAPASAPTGAAGSTALCPTPTQFCVVPGVS